MRLSVSEQLAAKLNQARQIQGMDAKALADMPRLAEMLWFLEAMSRRPGGADALGQKVMEKLPGRFEEVYRTGTKFCWGQDLLDMCAHQSLSGGLLRTTDYCPDVTQTLIDYLDIHAAEASAALADTEVKTAVFRELAFAHKQRVPVPFVGDSRIGKTKASAGWCEMRPGQARLVTVPDSPGDREFFKAHAEAFGIEAGPEVPIFELKDRVENVVQSAGLTICYDEAHFLVPSGRSASTAPKRLNWVRCQVIDRGIGCAFFMTPQNRRGGRLNGEDRTLAHYVEKTGYVLEQWLGRMRPPVILPSELSQEDLLSVARMNFPGIPAPLLKLIVARSMQSEGYLKNIEITAKRASFNAEEQGHRTPSKEDVLSAIEDMMPGIKSSTQAAGEAPAPEPRETPAAGSRGNRPASRNNTISSPKPTLDRLELIEA